METKTLRERAHIRAALRDAGRRVAADPVIRLVAWIDALIQAAVIDPQSLAGERERRGFSRREERAR